MESKIFYLAGKFGFVKDINYNQDKDYKPRVVYTSNVREAKVFNSFEEADYVAKSTNLGQHYFAILNPQNIQN